MTGKVDALRSKIISEISSGALPPGSRVPSRNQLARKYGFSRSTVDRALAGLVAEGRVGGQRGCGTFVLTPPHGNGIRRLYISAYSADGNIEYRVRERFFGGHESPFPLSSVYEEEFALRLGELTAPGAAMIWDCPSMNSLYGMKVLEQAGTPQLLINRTYLDYDSVSTDQAGTMHDALAWLLIEGGRDLTMVSYQPTPERPYLYDRVISFYECAAELGGRFQSSAIHCRPFADPAREIADLGRSLFAGAHCPKAIAVLHYDLALPLVTCALTHGKQPGRDYQLLCFDYVPALLDYPGVCMVRQNFSFMFREALRWLSEPRMSLPRPFREQIKAELIIHS